MDEYGALCVASLERGLRTPQCENALLACVAASITSGMLFTAQRGLSVQCIWPVQSTAEQRA